MSTQTDYSLQLQLQNRILAALPAAENERLAACLEEVRLSVGEVLCEPGEHIRYVYFPQHGIISLIAMMEDGGEIEVGVIGNEGMFGLPLALGTDSTPLKAVVQMSDDAVRMRADVFRKEVRDDGRLYKLTLRYAQAFFIQTAQTAACNRLHHLESRLARWLLMCHDRVSSDDLEMTHEFMANMLGVRRAGVSEVASLLQTEGIIRYRRGRVRILDRKGLEEASCECYGIVRKEFERLS